MARIELSRLAHSYRADPSEPSHYALQPFDLVWEDGGAYALLGPSGCGKTTLLNIISGLVRPSQGRVLFDGRDVTGLSPQRRNIAQVFQFPVIYDTMTVFDNLAFPLRNRGVDAASVRRRVAEVAEILELTRELPRRASGLTADAKQKISLGRGLVRSDVAAILFDEPLTVIDPHLKWSLRRKLKQIHRELKLTLVYVTHDQVEALTFADKVVVMSEGRVVQAGTAEQLFERPEHTFVGHFIGSPGMNFLPARVVDGANGSPVLTIAGEAVAPASTAVPIERLAAAPALKLGIRPEYLARVEPDAPGAVRARRLRVQHLGVCRMLTAMIGDAPVRARLPLDVPIDESLHLGVVNAHTCYYSDEELLQ
ncbi:MAG: ABC transporter ATP-binding protein [Burkholderiaceae bacterium]